MKMEFNTTKFDEARFKDRTEAMPVPELADFFDEPDEDKPEDSKPKYEWVVRGLTASEMAEAKEAQNANRSIESLIEGILSTENDEKVQAVKEAFGITQSKGGDTNPDDYVYRLSVLKQGSVNPVIDQAQAVKVSETYPITFYKLTNKIIQLTGMGKLLGE